MSSRKEVAVEAELATREDHKKFCIPAAENVPLSFRTLPLRTK